mgnify:CR=1 FL=1|tara:strand:- start:23 stop:325 length:303 start_codon:yes stop_codon:yes gene_type:complete
MIPDKATAIKSINPKAKFSYTKVDGKDVITWYETTPISDEEINSKLLELQTEYNNKDYQRKRKNEYPNLEDCIHAILDDDLDNLQALRQAVKNKYPKESE